MAKGFASQEDLKEKKISFSKLAKGCYGYTAEGDPNSGVIIGEKKIMVIEAQATPRMANALIKKIKKISDLPIHYLCLTHYHAVRVLGASAYKAKEIICSTKTLEMIVERGQQDWDSEFQRFPRLFRGHKSIPGLTWPTMIFDLEMELDLGNKKVQLLHVGEGHTRGDIVVWVPDSKVLYAGDLVEYKATPYCGDAQLKHWPTTLDKLRMLRPKALVPGRGDALTNRKDADKAILMTKEYVTTLFSETKKCLAKKYSLKDTYEHLMKVMRPKFGKWVIFDHCMCFNVKRAYDEAKGIKHPQIWTDKIDLDMWQQLNG